jgi:hypothetical protein
MMKARLRWIVGVVALAGRAAGVLAAQTPASPAFEVASVKPNRSDAPASSRFPLGPGDAHVPGRLFLATNQPLIVYLRFAHKCGQSDLLGLPAWVSNDRFDIEARAEGNPTKDQMRLMMQSLLVDRFKLVTHTERQTKPAFNLVLAKAGKPGRSFERTQRIALRQPRRKPAARHNLPSRPRRYRHPACRCRRFRAEASGRFPHVHPAWGDWSEKCDHGANCRFLDESFHLSGPPGARSYRPQGS